MNVRQIAEEFRVVVEADAAFASVACVNAHGTDDAAFPRVVFSATFRPLTGSGNVGVSMVTMTVETNAGDDADGAVNAGIVDKLRTKIIGTDETTARDLRAAIAAIITAAGSIELDPRYLPTDETTPARDGDRFRALLRIKAGVLLKPPAL